MTPIQYEIKNFIEQQRGFFIEPYDENTRLQEDLGIYGDDAAEFFIEFSKKFNVDISNFSVDTYFEEESSGFILFLSRLFLGTNKGLRKDKKIITIKALEEAIETGSLS